MKAVVIGIKVSPEQKEKIKATAAALKMSMSEYLKINIQTLEGPATYRKEVQKLIELSESLSALSHSAEKEGFGKISEKIESTVSLLNFLLKQKYESKIF